MITYKNLGAEIPEDINLSRQLKKKGKYKKLNLIFFLN